LRENDTPETVANKVRLATILGTWQSTLTDFKYLRKIWKDNTEEERLLGVSLTGQFGHKFFSGQRRS
jgi:ribonucleoside-diphosphate reductase alpha chain